MNTSPATRMRLLLGERGIRIKFSDAAMACIGEAGADVDSDLADLESGERTAETLLAHCLDGADADREQGWRDYVAALAEVATETPCYVESRLKDGTWTREGWNAPRVGGHYAYAGRDEAERAIREVGPMCDADGEEYETRIVDAEPGAMVEQ